MSYIERYKSGAKTYFNSSRNPFYS